MWTGARPWRWWAKADRGKSVTALSTVSLVPGATEITGSVKYVGQEMVGADDATLRKIRGNDISFIFPGAG